MKETKFIEQNKEKWGTYENMARLNLRDPDKLSELFVQITDDLSYARTFYPNRYIGLYLNFLAQKLFYHIYKNRSGNWRQFVSFWQEDLPQIVYLSRRELLASLVIFILAVSIGVLSSVYDPNFCRSILGDVYVDMTISNIENNDPMAVYKDMNEVDMWLGITFNNLRVAFITFIFGLVFSVGAVFIILYNGVMVGTFQYFFIERGLFVESFLTIWLHGTLEMASLVIAGGGGYSAWPGFCVSGHLLPAKSFSDFGASGFKIVTRNCSPHYFGCAH
ncbi:MAG: stage II sporulation protein M [Bacteroidia bacterium]|nr:stage II sporulation protein M [Bacteroidia bacterium]